MPTVDLIEEFFVAAEPARVAAAVREPDRWAAWWPDLTLRIREDRGRLGARFAVVGALVGTMELWLEPVADGVIAHHYLRAEPARPLSPRATRRAVRRRVRHLKRSFWAFKDELEGDRRPGEPRRATESVPGRAA